MSSIVGISIYLFLYIYLLSVTEDHLFIMLVGAVVGVEVEDLVGDEAGVAGQEAVEEVVVVGAGYHSRLYSQFNTVILILLLQARNDEDDHQGFHDQRCHSCTGVVGRGE